MVLVVILVVLVILVVIVVVFNSDSSISSTDGGNTISSNRVTEVMYCLTSCVFRSGSVTLSSSSCWRVRGV